MLFHFSLHILCCQWSGKCSPGGSASRIKVENADAISISYHRLAFLCGWRQRWPYLWVKVHGAGLLRLPCSGAVAPHHLPPRTAEWEVEFFSPTLSGCALRPWALIEDCTGSLGNAPMFTSIKIMWGFSINVYLPEFRSRSTVWDHPNIGTRCIWWFSSCRKNDWVGVISSVLKLVFFF